MVVGNGRFGVISHLIVGGLRGYSPPEHFCIFLHLGLQFLHFLKQIFGYTASHYAHCCR